MAERVIKGLLFEERETKAIGFVGSMQNSPNAILAVADSTTFSSGNRWAVSAGIKGYLE